MKINSIIIFILMLEIAFSLIFINNLNIFQHMLFVQLIPSFLLAIFIGRGASGKKLFWLYIIVGSILYSIMMYILLLVTPMDVIENNTVQSSTSIFEFNKTIKFTTYLGFFIQELLLSSFVVLIIKIIRKINKLII